MITSLVDCYKSYFRVHSEVMDALDKPFDLTPNISVTLVKAWDEQVFVDKWAVKYGRKVYVYPVFSLKSPEENIFEWDSNIMWLKNRLKEEGDGISLEDRPDGFSSNKAYEHSRIIAIYCAEIFNNLFPFKPYYLDPSHHNDKRYVTLYYDQKDYFACCDDRLNRLWVSLIMSPNIVNDLKKNFKAFEYKANYQSRGDSLIRMH